MGLFNLRSLIAAVAINAFCLPAQADEMRTFTDDTGTEVTFPVNPKRIISLHDSLLTIPMLELGVLPVGSHGRGKSLAKAYIRTAMANTGTDLSNSDIEWIGGRPADIEQIAALKPDLSLTTQWQKADVAKLRLIAPTIVLHFKTRTDYSVYAKVADIIGKTAKLNSLQTRYKNQIDQIRAVIDTQNILVSTIHGHRKGLYVFNPAGNLGKVLIDAGFQRPAIMDSAKKGDRATWFDAETLPQFDGDFIITSYRYGAGDTPETVKGYFEKVVPGYCEQLHACRENQMFMLSMDEITGSSYYGLSAVAYGVLAALGGRDYAPMPR